MLKKLMPASAMLTLFGLAQTAFAQGGDGGGGGGDTKSYAEMFLWSDDVIGLIIIYFLLALSVVSIGLSIVFLIKNRRTTLVPEETKAELQRLLSEKKYREAIDYANADESYLGTVSASGLNEAANGFSAMERSIEETGDAETSRLLRPIEFLNVIGNISPMLGLFGTVYGMILAFQTLVASGGQPDPVELASGISTALVTTFWGLVVAIPALAAYALVRNNVDALTSEGLIAAEELISPFKPSQKKSSSSSSRSSSSSSSSSSDQSSSGSSRPRATPQPQG